MHESSSLGSYPVSAHPGHKANVMYLHSRTSLLTRRPMNPGRVRATSHSMTVSRSAALSADCSLSSRDPTEYTILEWSWSSASSSWDIAESRSTQGWAVAK
jgi:hypothetical protein